MNRFKCLFGILLTTLFLLGACFAFADKPFLMPIADVFSIAGRGTIVTGIVERGEVVVGQEIELIGLGETRKVIVSGIQMSPNKDTSRAKAGDNVGLLLRGIDKSVVKRGQVLVKVGSVKLAMQFKATVHMLTAAEGGRQAAISSGYRPLIFIRTSEVTGVLSLPKGPDALQPGANASVTIQLNDATALEQGLKFSFREGSKITGTGVVEKLLN